MSAVVIIIVSVGICFYEAMFNTEATLTKIRVVDLVAEFHSKYLRVGVESYSVLGSTDNPDNEGD